MITKEDAQKYGELHSKIEAFIEERVAAEIEFNNDLWNEMVDEYGVNKTNSYEHIEPRATYDYDGFMEVDSDCYTVTVSYNYSGYGEENWNIRIAIEDSDIYLVRSRLEKNMRKSFENAVQKTKEVKKMASLSTYKNVLDTVEKKRQELHDAGLIDADGNIITKESSI